MAITTLKVLASLLQLHGPGATIQSDHQGIDALLSDLQSSDQPVATEVYFRRGGFVRRGACRRLSQSCGYCSGCGRVPQRGIYSRILG